jgi:hypothetical protein
MRARAELNIKYRQYTDPAASIVNMNLPGIRTRAMTACVMRELVNAQELRVPYVSRSRGMREL